MNGLSADGRWLGIYQAYTATLHVYSRPQLEPAAKLICMENIAGFQFSPSGDEVAVSSRGQIEFWNTQNWERTRVLTNFSGLPHVGVLVQPDTGEWWLAREPRFACLHEVGSLEPRLALPSSMSPIAVSADGRHLAMSVEARRLQVWDLVLVRMHLRELGVDWDDSLR
jgi:WD40 repeat protein